MHKKISTRKKILISSITLILILGAFIIRYITDLPKEVANIQTNKGNTVSINSLYLEYQLKISQFVTQKNKNLSLDKIDTSYWSSIKNGITLEDKLKKELLSSTKSQLIILKYASENNITLDDTDKNKVDELVKANSSPVELAFILGDKKLNEHIFRRIFENLILSNKTIEHGANKTNIDKAEISPSVKAVLCDELIFEVKTSDGTSYEDAKLAAKTMAQKVKANLNNDSDLKKVAEKYSLGYKKDVKLSLFKLSENEINTKSISAAVTLKENEISEPIPFYEKKLEEPNAINSNISTNKSVAPLISAYIIFKSTNSNLVGDTNKNIAIFTNELKKKKFKANLLKEVENNNFEINSELIKNLK